jgi:hypothetical protein
MARVEARADARAADGAVLLGQYEKGQALK